MNGSAARHEAAKILAELPDRISDVIKPFAHHGPGHPALVQGDVPGPMRSWRPPSLTRRSSEEVAAFVELLPGSAATPSDMMAHAMRLLAPYKRPSEIIVLDVLPAASTGKILKHQLAEAARSGNRADIGG